MIRQAQGLLARIHTGQLCFNVFAFEVHFEVLLLQLLLLLSRKNSKR